MVFAFANYRCKVKHCLSSSCTIDFYDEMFFFYFCFLQFNLNYSYLAFINHLHPSIHFRSQNPIFNLSFIKHIY